MFWFLRGYIKLLGFAVLVAFLVGRFGCSGNVMQMGQNLLGDSAGSVLNNFTSFKTPSSSSSYSTSASARAVLPRPDLTPGAIDPLVTQANIWSTICRRGYTATVRPPYEYTNALKHELMSEYGVPGSIHNYELDHDVPLELGGCPDCKSNLWPQPWSSPGAHEKDEVENYLNRQVCSHAMSLAEAQREIASDWYAVYLRMSPR